jgi:hypothetical protein
MSRERPDKDVLDASTLRRRAGISVVYLTVEWSLCYVSFIAIRGACKMFRGTALFLLRYLVKRTSS